MAAIIDLLLQNVVTAEVIVDWLKKNLDQGNVPEDLQKVKTSRQEFVPFFLNYLRDQTLHLLQNAKSANSSPMKTPIPNETGQQEFIPRRRSSANRVQLFGDSPLALETKDFSPNSSFDSPHSNKSIFRGNKVSQSKNNATPSRLSPSNPAAETSDNQRGRQRISLGEFLLTPDSSHQRRSPHSSGQKDRHKPDDRSPNALRRSSGKKRQQGYGASKLAESTPHGYGSSKLVESTPPIFSLNSISDFPQITDTETVSNTGTGGGNDKSKPMRRINPTLVKRDMIRPPNNAFQNIPESFEKILPENVPMPKPGKSAEVGMHLAEERKLLRQEKARILQQALPVTNDESPSPFGSSTSVNVLLEHPASRDMTPRKAALDRVSSVEMCRADKESVTHQEKLSALAALYSALLQSNLFPNISVELYFLVQLLTATRTCESALQDASEHDDLFFCSVHNSVYFSVTVIEKQIRLIKLLDKGTLRLLAENKRIGDFHAELKTMLLGIYEAAPCKPAVLVSSTHIAGVAFQAETDNRNNFPSDRSFQVFKKQRDKFYDLLRDWQANHMAPGWRMAEELGEAIRFVIHSRTELSNYLHFARLFQSQLIKMCKDGSPVHIDSSEESSSLLSHLKKTNPEKFKRLQERFITPMNAVGPCPPPSFPGCQEFFRDFIVIASNPIFNQHLIDTFSSKISELNSMKFLQGTIQARDDDEGAVKDEYELFATCLLTLRLLGKFMGFVLFHPYQSEEKMAESAVPSYLSIRNQTRVQFDVLGHLRESCLGGHLTLTVPWIVQFLSMMDQMAPHLQYFQEVISVLLYVNRVCYHVFIVLPERYTHLMITVAIGWLLENPVFPEGVFFADVTADLPPYNQSADTVDAQGLLDQHLFYRCCPYFGELKSLLVEFSMGAKNRNNTIRKITPVTTSGSPTQKTGNRNIQTQLEENFFHNHTASLKRSVEFVAERTASNYIKMFRGTVLQTSLIAARRRIQELSYKKAEKSPRAQNTEKVSNEISKIYQATHEQLHCSSEDLRNFCQPRIHGILTMMLPDEQCSSVVAMAAVISCQLAEDRVTQWMANHITLSYISRELDRINKSLPKPPTPEAPKPTRVEGGSFEEKEDLVINPSDLLIEIKESLKSMLTQKQTPTEEEVCDCLRKIQRCLKATRLILPSVLKSFAFLVLEMTIILITVYPSVWSPVICDRCLSLWQSELRDVTHFSSFLSLKLMQSLQKSCDPTLSWKHFSDLMKLLLCNNLLSAPDLCSACINLTHLDQVTADSIFQFFCDLAVSPDLCSMNSSTEVQDTMQWLSKFCNDENESSKLADVRIECGTDG